MKSNGRELCTHYCVFKCYVTAFESSFLLTVTISCLHYNNQMYCKWWMSHKGVDSITRTLRANHCLSSSGVHAVWAVNAQLLHWWNSFLCNTFSSSAVIVVSDDFTSREHWRQRVKPVYGTHAHQTRSVINQSICVRTIVHVPYFALCVTVITKDLIYTTSPWLVFGEKLFSSNWKESINVH